MLDGLRGELAAVKSDLAWRRLVDALARKYSPTQPRVLAEVQNRFLIQFEERSIQSGDAVTLLIMRQRVHSRLWKPQTNISISTIAENRDKLEKVVTGISGFSVCLATDTDMVTSKAFKKRCGYFSQDVGVDNPDQKNGSLLLHNISTAKRSSR